MPRPPPAATLCQATAADSHAQGRYRHGAGLFRLHAARGSGISPPRVPDISRGIPFPACNETRWSCPPTH
ncbi:hypothetical protein GBZ48_23170 [Azospirillum melinis]|uniref:Uncharacterized protein n=1 Tax=Azospirillum melinis TaxID=328839 RepID=A0ABX2KEY9_9PROT|nr:hypothetical protein [Azospirillum melinis]